MAVPVNSGFGELDGRRGGGSAPAAENERAAILIVDDLPEKLLVFETILSELNQELVVVRSGSDALREVLRREFAVILLDVNMPDIDGLETARLIRSYKRSAHTPIIFVTAYADELQTAQGYSLGAVDYILSPVVADVLRSKVRVFVDLHIMQRRLRQQALERIALARAEAGQRIAEEKNRRSLFLAHASRVLSGSLDIGVAMQRLLELVVPDMASQALLWLRGDEQIGERVMCCDAPSRAGDPPLIGEAPLAGLSESLREALQEPERARQAGGAAVEQLRFETPAGVVLPLSTGEQVLGALLIHGAQAGLDWTTLEELAGRAAIAFENGRLYRKLQIEIVERRQAEVKLLEASQRKDEFLAMLSHELRNPLAPIRNAVEVIRRIAPSGDQRLAWATDVTDRQVHHLTRLVDELLDVARISQGKIVLKKEPVDLLAVIAQGVETVRELIEARRHQLIQRLPDMPVWLRGDAARLAQVIANLLHNAAKYTEEGGVIELSLTAADGQAQIAVRDNGLGIDASLLPNVFDLFEQGKRSLDRSQGGLGVGLTLVQRLVQLHQGKVEAFSAGTGHGSEFRVTLPCLGEIRTGVPEPATTPATAAREGCRVLVVDDNRDAADSIALFLELAGHQVKAVSDGMQALACAATFAPAVILLDIGLPIIDGYEVARRLRQIPEVADSLLIALTGYGQKGDRRLAHEAGFAAHLVKPADPEALVQQIARWLAGRSRGEPGVARPLPA